MRPGWGSFDLLPNGIWKKCRLAGPSIPLLCESPALSGPLSLPVQESCHTALSFTAFLLGLGAWSSLACGGWC